MLQVKLLRELRSPYLVRLLEVLPQKKGINLVRLRLGLGSGRDGHGCGGLAAGAGGAVRTAWHCMAQHGREGCSAGAYMQALPAAAPACASALRLPSVVRATFPPSASIVAR